ncbi:hypothetical protein Q1695_012603 [Nippostrongylus brasiliensis]|nr:hypothetical protein Q1695_012603 [Nippostrongylus brasiliensis]
MRGCWLRVAVFWLDSADSARTVGGEESIPAGRQRPSVRRPTPTRTPEFTTLRRRHLEFADKSLLLIDHVQSDRHR